MKGLRTPLIKEWWDGGDSVTLITRPRRFGKTLNMSMLEKFFSTDYAGRSDLFEGISIWEDENYRQLQRTYPVIFLSFAGVKEGDYKTVRRKICEIIASQYAKREFLLEGNLLARQEKEAFRRKTIDMDDVDTSLALHQLADYLSRHHEKKTIILLDEYDTPMQEAYVGGYWNDMAAFTRGLFNSTFKTNPYLERAIMTGITRVSRESIFSDLNNLKVITTTSNEYADCFGFTEEEVFTALDEQIAYGELDGDESAIWSLLLASGYLKVVSRGDYPEGEEDLSEPQYELAFTNQETRRAFRSMVRSWFRKGSANYNDFIQALLSGDLDAMNEYMNKVALATFSYFDTGGRPSEPERFYHGFVLGLMVELSGRYALTSNRESGFGRYNVMLEPLKAEDDAMILEFKVFQPRKEKDLEETTAAALAQIEEKRYAASLEAKGIAREKIRSYGFAFEGQNVLIQSAYCFSLICWIALLAN